MVGLNTASAAGRTAVAPPLRQGQTLLPILRETADLTAPDPSQTRLIPAADSGLVHRGLECRENLIQPPSAP